MAMERTEAMENQQELATEIHKSNNMPSSVEHDHQSTKSVRYVMVEAEEVEDDHEEAEQRDEDPADSSAQGRKG
eukprot:CAMPEP_0113946126 /NCGR_PEP_ID=MMETSP1339-20121228/54748_1 /TAXON_ID=94617 /ORGANISM="Fibrocapsa japonica" /LENGTH=73 /DNA_ID=CAMNT_0000952053 /DNA_START=39 /DNA_END=256 /DNA_ORIENTATION=+ /assembly_acc=CAM_ASM_000762